MRQQTLITVAVTLFSVFPIDSRAHAAAVDATQPIRITGFVEGSYAWASNAAGRTIVGGLYQRDHNQFVANGFQLGIDKPTRMDTLSAGFTARAMFGRSATPIRAAGLDLGTQGDLTQAFGTLNLPTASGAVQLSLGKMATLLGLEVIESIGNPNLTVGNQFVFVENFTDVGLDVNWIVDPRLSLRGRILNGWDLAEDNNEAHSFMGRIGWTPNERAAFAVVGFVGPEQADNVGNRRYGGEVLATLKRGAHALTLQGDLGKEEGIDAQWWAAGAWVVLGLRPGYDLALRADVLDDEDGARTSGVLGYPVHDGQRLTTATATLNIRVFDGALVRPEVRFDRSSLDAFDGHDSQVTLALGAAFVY
jgi:hypothetical protein